MGTLKSYLDEELEKICLFEATNSDCISVDEAYNIYKQIQNELKQEQYYTERIADEEAELNDWYNNNNEQFD